MRPKMTGSRYVLAVKNLKTSADYYQSLLGFETLWSDGFWHFLVRDKIIIMLGECADEIPAGEIGDHSYFGYFEVANIDGLYQEYQAKGVEFLSPLENKPWGQREFAIRTVDGHRIAFGEEIENPQTGI
ncbi:VOC family protein [Algoriphagus aestuariicola]|uniref:VOC family protein n=1 Tax=Algoriphagus aestuariicola TaxID=1852016 RepID=A0ABS3BV22_9BACT|nr:VOC family protein [Algoriphagus aestuariicola]MBN7803117.1 VOC family protein [Algoriphagus aestuariicola]